MTADRAVLQNGEQRLTQGVGTGSYRNPVLDEEALFHLPSPAASRKGRGNLNISGAVPALLRTDGFPYDISSALAQS